jgi:hypothetical protein
MGIMAAEDELRGCRKGAIADLRQARRRVWEREEKTPEPIASVGMACRLPGHIATFDKSPSSPHGPASCWLDPPAPAPALAVAMAKSTLRRRAMTSSSDLVDNRLFTGADSDVK